MKYITLLLLGLLLMNCSPDFPDDTIVEYGAIEQSNPQKWVVDDATPSAGAAITREQIFAVRITGAIAYNAMVTAITNGITSSCSVSTEVENAIDNKKEYSLYFCHDVQKHLLDGQNSVTYTVRDRHQTELIVRTFSLQGQTWLFTATRDTDSDSEKIVWTAPDQARVFLRINEIYIPLGTGASQTEFSSSLLPTETLLKIEAYLGGVRREIKL